ncbi:hypothetical protein D3C85_1546420 [compost metagenome]
MAASKGSFAKSKGALRDTRFTLTSGCFARKVGNRGISHLTAKVGTEARFRISLSPVAMAWLVTSPRSFKMRLTSSR